MAVGITLLMVAYRKHGMSALGLAIWQPIEKSELLFKGLRTVEAAIG